MSTRPEFTFQENLRSIRRRPTTKFILVEGIDDVPAYCSFFNAVVGPVTNQQWEILKAEGKSGVLNFLQAYTGDNIRFIVDRDFDEITLVDDRLVILRRYSIENYLICPDVISHCLSVPLKTNPANIALELRLNEFIEEINLKGIKLLKSCFYYQKVVAPTIEGPKPSWTDDSIYMKRLGNSWQLCADSIDEIINKLLPGLTDWSQVDSFFNEHFDSCGIVAYELPGKMLKEPLRRFVKAFFRSKKSKGGSQFNALDSFHGVAIANLSISSEFREHIHSVVDFIKNVQN